MSFWIRWCAKRLIFLIGLYELMAILIGGARFSEQASLFQTLVDANVSLFRWLRSDPWGPTLLEVLFVTLVVQGVATTRTKSNRKDAIRFYLMGHQNRITAEVEQLRVLLDQSTETKDKVDSLIASLRRLSREVASAESTIEQVDLTLFERHLACPRFEGHRDKVFHSNWRLSWEDEGRTARSSSGRLSG